MMPQYWWFTYCLLPGLLASAILKMDGIGGLAGWRWIFILEGIATILIALISSRLLPADLSSARFFTEEERAFSRQLMALTTSSRILTFLLVYRIRCSDSVVSSAQLPEHVQKINPGSNVVEKGDETTAKFHQSVYEEDEKFEWGEVLRGNDFFVIQHPF